MAARSFIGIVMVALSAVVTASGGLQAGPELIVLEPTADSILSGHVVFKAEVTPAGTIVQDVAFLVDGQPACHATKRPFECEYDAGSSGLARSVRVVAMLGGGGRLLKAIRTSASQALFHSAIDLILVSVRVSDEQRRFVRGLQASDFRISEDGQPQEIASFGNEETKTDILLALDVSGSMTPAFDDLKKTVRDFLGDVRQQDSVALAAFNAGLWLVAPASATPGARLTALEGLRPGGGTALYDAMVRGAALLRPRTGRRVLIMFTDGDDVSSRTSADAAPVALQNADAMLYIVAAGKGAKDEQLRRQLTAVAGSTGGSAFFSPHMSDLHDHFATILQDISEQYLLAYRPERALGDGQWRQITVTTTNKKNKVRAREGYFATPRGGGHL